MKGKEILRVGMAAFDLVTFDRNRGISDPERKTPKGFFLSAAEVADIMPGINRKGLTGAAVFYDGQIYNPPRLALSFMRSAVEQGAQVANYAELKKIVVENKRVVGAEIVDTLSGGSHSIRCKSMLLTTGGWTQKLLADAAQIPLQRPLAFSRDLAFVVNRSLVGKYGFACPLMTKDVDAVFDRGGRHLFVAPWRGQTLVGVWHGIFKKTPDEVATNEEELAGYISEVNAAQPSFNLSLDDISMILTGLTLYGEEAQQGEGKMSFGKRSMLIDNAVEHDIQNLVSLIGVRATTARGMAEKAIDLILSKIGHRKLPSVSSSTPIFGGNFKSIKQLLSEVKAAWSNSNAEETCYALARNYGGEYQRVLDYGKADESLLKSIGLSSVIGAEIVHAAREEMAMTLNDVIFRRTDLGTLGGINRKQIATCGQLMAQELGWDEKQLSEEIALVEAHVNRRGFIL
jgi:glycerol-3-phosphate dehydrogenase